MFDNRALITDRIPELIRNLNRRQINFHSVLITRNGETLYEEYREPFCADKPHRMYSVTKSFVAIAIGCLMDEGKLNLDDPITGFFPDKLPKELPEEMRLQTIRNMLMMSTCLSGVNWFKPGVTDRTAYYFSQQPTHPAGTLFDYDSTGSYVLGALVERLSGMKLIDYMRIKFLDEIGGFENAEILETPDGTAWGDSALLCTTRALERFARFVMQDGSWNGKQLVNAGYVRQARSLRITNRQNGARLYNTFGYGYQIWLTEQGGFSFHGMGGQHAICLPDQKLVFVITGDNQYNSMYAEILYDEVFRALSPDNGAYPSKNGLFVADGGASSDFASEIDGAWFTCKPNRMEIKRFRFVFDGSSGVFEYENAQGLKKLPFGFGHNVFEKFPQLGYSDQRGNVHDESSPFMYDCAVSGGWIEPKKLFLRVQIIDRYLGSTMMTFGFLNRNVVGVRMDKVAEDFLTEYYGWIGAYRA